MARTPLPVLRVRGSGGLEFDLDLHPSGSRQRELFDEQVRKGELTVLDGDVVEPDVDVGSVPNGPVESVLSWVRGHNDPTIEAVEGWEDRARTAAEVEQVKDRPRSTLIDRLNELLGVAEEAEEATDGSS